LTISENRRAALRVVRRDDAASPLEATYRRFCPYVAAVILRLGGHRDDLDDMVQDVFVEAARGIHRLREPEALKGWLATIAVRLVRRRLRLRKLRRLLGFEVPDQSSFMVDSGASPLDRLLLAAVGRILEDVAVTDRLAWSLHHLEGEKLERVAKLCGCSCATAKRRIARVQTAIRESLGDG
jgi:RNA polymerase sigma-70 factor (ECF subfamily)